MTLLHLLSNETLQNLLPVIALKPARVIQLASQGQYLNRAASIKQAYNRLKEKHKAILPSIEFINPIKELNSPTPSVQETFALVDQIADQYPDLCINFTGATKPMSIGAYLVGKERHFQSYYCDTQAGRIVPGGTGEGEEELAIGPIFDLLDVEVILEAYGKSLGKHWRSQRRSDAEIDFGKTAFSLVQNKDAKFYNFVKKIRKSPHLRPLPQTLDTDIKDFLHRAVALKYLRQNQQGGFELPFQTTYENDWEKSKHIEQMLAHLDGFPFEYYVYNCVKNSSRYSHPLSNVEPIGYPISFGEVDIICVDKQEKGLACISCKGTFTGANKLEHLESFVQRANNLGGTFSKKILCVASNYFPEVRKEGDPDFRKILSDKCKSLKIELLIGSEIQNHFLS
jgi:hypothetical protein